MIVEFMTNYLIGAYQHLRCEFETRSGEVYSKQHNVIEFFSEVTRHVGGVSGFLHQYN